MMNANRLISNLAVVIAIPFFFTQNLVGQQSMADLRDSLGIEFKLVTPGEFRRYSSSKNIGEYKVKITKPYYIGLYEITQKQWSTLVKTQPWEKKKFTKSGDDFPACFVSWEDANEFCKRLSKREGAVYRLPTEAEWELACRAGTATRFSFGDNTKKYTEYGWCYENAWKTDEKFAHQVGQKKPNPFGLYDMYGNLGEWCLDGEYDPDEVDKSKTHIDPLQNLESRMKIVRGFSWSDKAELGGSSENYSHLHTYGNSALGFRVVREFATGK